MKNGTLYNYLVSNLNAKEKLEIDDNLRNGCTKEVKASLSASRRAALFCGALTFRATSPSPFRWPSTYAACNENDPFVGRSC